MGKRFGAVALMAGVAAGGVGGAVFGVPLLSGAQEGTTATTAPAGDQPAKPAGGPLRQALTNLVERGTITQPQADAVQTEVRAVAEASGRPGPGHHPRRGHGMRVATLTAAAEALGMSEADLRTELRAGKTIAAVAGEKGVAVDTVVAAMVDAASARIDEAVAAGRIPEEKGAEMKAGLEERITRFVNEGGPRHRDGGAPPAGEA